MLKDRQSKLVHYGIGIVLEDKPRKTDIAKITNIEEFPFTEGKLSDEKEELKHELPDKQGVPRKSKAKRDIVIEATWLGGYDSNRMTSPDLIKNETVDIYRYADTQEYYWRKRGREPGIRRLETVCYMYGNLQKPLEEWDKRSSYWHEISTHDKHIITQTTTSDGEAFSYNVQINPKKDQIYHGDDIGNYYRLLSSENLIENVNADGTYHKLDKKIYYIHASECVVIKTPQVIMDTEDLYVKGNIHSGGAISGREVEADTVKGDALLGPVISGSAPDRVHPNDYFPDVRDPYPSTQYGDEFHDLEPPK